MRLPASFLIPPETPVQAAHSGVVRTTTFVVGIMVLLAAHSVGELGPMQSPSPWSPASAGYRTLTVPVQVQLRAFVGTAPLENCISVRLNGTTVGVWGNLSLAPGTYPLSAPENLSGSSVCGAYFSYGFQGWTLSANLTVQDPASNRTNLTVRGPGVVSASYKGWNGPWDCAAPSIWGASCSTSPVVPILALGVAVVLIVAALLLWRRHGRRNNPQGVPLPVPSRGPPGGP